MNKKQTNKFLVSAAIAGLVSLGANALTSDKSNTVTPAGKKPKGDYKCQGGNTCSGKGGCGGVHDDGTEYTCAGQNQCAGKGWVYAKNKDHCDELKKEVKMHQRKAKRSKVRY